MRTLGQTLHRASDGKPDTRDLALQSDLSSRKVVLNFSNTPFSVVNVEMLLRNATFLL